MKKLIALLLILPLIPSAMADAPLPSLPGHISEVIGAIHDAPATPSITMTYDEETRTIFLFEENHHERWNHYGAVSFTGEETKWSCEYDKANRCWFYQLAPEQHIDQLCEYSVWGRNPRVRSLNWWLVTLDPAEQGGRIYTDHGDMVLNWSSNDNTTAMSLDEVIVTLNALQVTLELDRQQNVLAYYYYPAENVRVMFEADGTKTIWYDRWEDMQRIRYCWDAEKGWFLWEDFRIVPIDAPDGIDADAYGPCYAPRID